MIEIFIKVNMVDQHNHVQDLVSEVTFRKVESMLKVIMRVLLSSYNTSYKITDFFLHFFFFKFDFITVREEVKVKKYSETLQSTGWILLRPQSVADC